MEPDWHEALVKAGRAKIDDMLNALWGQGMGMYTREFDREMNGIIQGLRMGQAVLESLDPRADETRDDYLERLNAAVDAGQGDVPRATDGGKLIRFGLDAHRETLVRARRR